MLFPFAPFWLATKSLFREGLFKELLLFVPLIGFPPILLMLLDELELEVDRERDREYPLAPDWLFCMPPELYAVPFGPYVSTATLFDKCAVPIPLLFLLFCLFNE